MCPVRRGKWQEACLSSRQPIAKKMRACEPFVGAAPVSHCNCGGEAPPRMRGSRASIQDCINTRLSRILGNRPVTIEKSGAVWTVILLRPQARNAVNPETATKLYDAFLAFHREGAGA